MLPRGESHVPSYLWIRKKLLTAWTGGSWGTLCPRWVLVPPSSAGSIFFIGARRVLSMLMITFIPIFPCHVGFVRALLCRPLSTLSWLTSWPTTFVAIRTFPGWPSLALQCLCLLFRTMLMIPRWWLRLMLPLLRPSMCMISTSGVLRRNWICRSVRVYSSALGTVGKMYLWLLSGVQLRLKFLVFFWTRLLLRRIIGAHV